MAKQEFTSAKTSINKTRLPSVFTKALKMDLFEGVNVDIGGGKFDNVNELLKTQGKENVVLDKFNRSKEHNTAIELRFETDKADTGTISNVLNVIQEASIRSEVIAKAKSLVKQGGKVLISVYEGDKSGTGKQSGCDQWQENRNTDTYMGEIKRHFSHVEMKNNIIIALDK